MELLDSNSKSISNTDVPEIWKYIKGEEGAAWEGELWR